MNNDDDLVFLNQGDDDENAIFQTQEERNNLLKEYNMSDEDLSELDMDLETTIRIAEKPKRPYWQRVFG